MIHADEKGNRYLVMQDGGRVPLQSASVHITLQSAIPQADGSVAFLSTMDALAIHQTSAAYWFDRWKDAQQTIADLRSQLTQRDE